MIKFLGGWGWNRRIVAYLLSEYADTRSNLKLNLFMKSSQKKSDHERTAPTAMKINTKMVCPAERISSSTSVMAGSGP